MTLKEKIKAELNRLAKIKWLMDWFILAIFCCAFALFYNINGELARANARIFMLENVVMSLHGNDKLPADFYQKLDENRKLLKK